MGGAGRVTKPAPNGRVRPADGLAKDTWKQAIGGALA